MLLSPFVSLRHSSILRENQTGNYHPRIRELHFPVTVYLGEKALKVLSTSSQMRSGDTPLCLGASRIGRSAVLASVSGFPARVDGQGHVNRVSE
jgi:hypothetical protein